MPRRRPLLQAVLLLLLLLAAPLAGAVAQAPAAPPGGLAPDYNHAETWRQIRQGERGHVVLPNPRAAVLIQSEGENWRDLRNGPYHRWAAYILLGMTAIVALFFALHGRIHLQHDRTGIEVERFTGFERAVHWLTASCFIVLALTGLNLMFGRTLLIPLLGKETFAAIAMTGKYLHNYLAFGFMAGIVLMFVAWVRYNLPNRCDVTWLLKGGGLFTSTHVPSTKFNAGQKLLFWAVILGGVALSLSGLQLLFPYQIQLFDKLFAVLSWLGLNVPADLAPLQEQQITALWHGTVGVLMTAMIVAHIYLGTIGMEGAFHAMGSGKVDLTWAREHHDLWAEELEGKRSPGPLPGE
jgi:formate dehydrogenase subunit gamma